LAAETVHRAPALERHINKLRFVFGQVSTRARQGCVPRVIDDSASDKNRESAAKFAVLSRIPRQRCSSCRSAEQGTIVARPRRDVINLAAAMRRPLADRPGSRRDLFTSPTKDQPPLPPLSLSPCVRENFIIPRPTRESLRCPAPAGTGP